MSVYYTASKSRSGGRSTWSVHFRHPLVARENGDGGRKVGRSLGTTDAEEADNMVEELNELLSNKEYWPLSARRKAEKEFSDRVVDIFYDKIDLPSEGGRLRDELLPLPGRAEGFSTLLLLGTTGAGKTTLLRHLIGSDHTSDRFPSTAPGRTTTADTEVVVAEQEEFEAAVTFMTREKVKVYVEECVTSACVQRWRGESQATIAASLLEDTSSVFRLKYALGDWESTEDDDEGWGFRDGQLSSPPHEEALDQDKQEQHLHALRGFVERIETMTDEASEDLKSELEFDAGEMSSSDRAAVEALLEESIQQGDAFTELCDDIMDAVRERFDNLKESCLSKATTGWPRAWTYQTEDRDEMIQRLRWFSSNAAQRFGELLTPVVEGIRLRGPLFPNLPEVKSPKLVLRDTQGLGHNPESAGSVSTDISAKFSSTDLILLVDNATAPMQAAPIAAIRSAAMAGHQDKLAIAFTHFDQMEGDNLPNAKQKIGHVWQSVEGAIESLRPALRDELTLSLQDNLKARRFFLGWLNEATGDLPPKMIEQFTQLIQTTEASHVDQPGKCRPVYDYMSLGLAGRDATAEFHERWGALLGLTYTKDVSKEHWSRVKALNRRIAERMAVEYDTLRPVADVYELLLSAVSRFLENPVDWEGLCDKEERKKALDAIRRDVSDALRGLCEERLIDEHRREWIRAYRHWGRGSTFVRARAIRNLMEEAAPVPQVEMERGASAFLSELTNIVKRAVPTSAVADEKAILSDS